LLACGVAALRADVTFPEFDFSPPGQLQSWTDEHAWADIVRSPMALGRSGYIRISLNDTRLTADESWMLLAGPKSSSLFAGNWDGDMNLTFEFMGRDYAPGTLELRWEGESGYTWQYMMAPSAVKPGLPSDRSVFADWTGLSWVPSATEEMFLSDLASVDWIGIQIMRSVPGQPLFGIQDNHLHVPEPQEYVLLAVALAVVALGWRRKSRAVVRA
jgi:hypothetical protein